MQPKAIKINLGDKEYGLLFTINIVEAIQDKYDIPASELVTLLKDEKKNIKVLKFLITALINEAQDDLEPKGEHVDEQYVGRKITTWNVRTLQESILKAFSEGAPKTDPDGEPDPNGMSGH